MTVEVTMVEPMSWVGEQKFVISRHISVGFAFTFFCFISSLAKGKRTRLVTSSSSPIWFDLAKLPRLSACSRLAHLLSWRFLFYSRTICLHLLFSLFVLFLFCFSYPLAFSLKIWLSQFVHCVAVILPLAEETYAQWHEESTSLGWVCHASFYGTSIVWGRRTNALTH